MTGTQVTLFQLDNYGPWTVTPEPRPEPRLQALQASLYADLAEAVGDRGGYVFATRFDNVVAVTNGLDADAHRSILAALADTYPVSVSAGVGVHDRPAEALAAATAALQDAGSAQDADRAGELVGEFLADAGAASPSEGHVQVAHFDVVDATGQLTDRLDAYGAHLRVREATQALSAHLYEDHDALAFFVGGDNVIAVCPGLDAADYQRAIDHVATTTGLDLQVGVGTGPTARDAGMEAKFALEDCRREGSRVEGLATAAAD